jgi:hypothetical protein
VVTAPIQTQGGEFRQVAKEIASIDTMRQFLQEYRAQYLDPKAATIPPDPTQTGKPEAAPKPESKADPAKAAKPDKVASAEPPPKAEEKTAGH